MTGAEFFGSILETARGSDASDIHLVEGLPPAFRLSGEIGFVGDYPPMTRESLMNVVLTVLSDGQRERLSQERELCVSHYHEVCGRIRLSLYHRLDAIEMAIRMCNLSVKSREELGLPPAVDRLIEMGSGLVLVTGPTGVGKTTTMNYMIDAVNRARRGKIITIEDPVEFEHAHKKCVVTQIEVGTDTNSFAHCLRHVLRLDPDVIAIGEMRDLDTMETALTAAETGHLVLATLHTPNAVSTVERIVSSFEGSRQSQVALQLSTTLQGVIAQRLVPGVDRQRRLLATEVLLATDAARAIVREGRAHKLYNVISTSRAVGMHTMEDSLAGLYRRGEITLDSACAASISPERLQQLIG